MKAKLIYEMYNEESVWRMTSMDWLLSFLKNEHIHHGNSFISLSYDSESGGQDHFGGKEIIIEFDVYMIEKEAYNQGYPPVDYTEDYMDEFPEVCRYITGYTSKEDYYNSIDVLDDEEAYNSMELTWDMVITSNEHEEEIVLKYLDYKDGLIKSVSFMTQPDKELIKHLNKKHITYNL